SAGMSLLRLGIHGGPHGFRQLAFVWERFYEPNEIPNLSVAQFGMRRHSHRGDAAANAREYVFPSRAALESRRRQVGGPGNGAPHVEAQHRFAAEIAVTCDT